MDYQFSLLLGETGALVVIESPFTITRGDEERRFEPAKWSDLGVALEFLLFKTVDAINAYKEGRLEIVFKEGSSLTVEPHADFESWHLVSEAGVTTDAGVMVVSTPGGELAVWGGVGKAHDS